MNEVYFPVLDGSLGYDCVRCGSKCCHGFGVGRSELVPLLARRPEVAPFLIASSGQFGVMDFSEGCWFLAGDGRCRVELEDGRAAKPAVCRLFPFTRIHRIGDVTLVEPQLLRCPLEDRAGQGVRYAELLAELAASEGAVPVIETRVPSGLADGWQARERDVVALAGAHLDDGDPLPLVAAQAPASEERLARLRAAWHRSLGLDESAARRAESEVARPLALLAPLLRWKSLFTIGSDPYPKVLNRLPALLLGTALYAGLAVRALGHPPSLRSLGELFHATPLDRELLARWDRSARLVEPKPSTLPSPLDAAHDRWMALLADGQGTVGSTFDAATEHLDPAHRPLILRSVAARFGALIFS